jgi:hypothetical protein
MAKTFQQVATALTANSANFANMGLASAAEVLAVAQFLAAAGLKPGLSVEILRLINNVQLTENR